MCGSFCTFKASYTVLEKLKEKYSDIIPIMSYNAYTTDTRFGNCDDWNERIEDLCQRKIVHTALQADKFVTTKSEGEEPNRYLVIIPTKKENIEE